jgi:hypothetical protein
MSCVSVCILRLCFTYFDFAWLYPILWLLADLQSRVGQTGLGKSTLVNTIFASHLIDSKGRLTPNEPVRSTTEIQTVSHSTCDREVP